MLNLLRLITFLMLFGCLVPVSGFAQGVGAGTVDLQASFVEGGTGIDFGDLRSLDQNGDPSNDIQLSQVRLTINNTAGQSYIVTQTVNGDTVNQSGASLPPDAIRFRVQIESGDGLVRTPDMAPLGAGAQEIYFSDNMGQNAVLLITYEIRVPGGQRAGRYYNTVNYRVDVR